MLLGGSVSFWLSFSSWRRREGGKADGLKGEKNANAGFLGQVITKGGVARLMGVV